MAGVGGDVAFDNIADPDLPFITVGQARRIRSLVRTAFAENGCEVTVFSDHVRDDRGRVFGLWNLASACGSDPAGETAWPRVVGAHVMSLLAAVGGDIFAGLSGVEVRARTYARLYPADQFDPAMFGHATEVMPGLLEFLAFDLSDTVTTLRPVDVERLILPEVLARLGDAVPGPHGVLACVPACRHLAVHVIRDKSVVPSLQLMARFAASLYDSAAGPLSPSLFWWRDGTWETVSRTGPDGEVEIVLTDELRRLLNQLAR